ncbi:MAG: ATP synthase F1 subunit gamma [bacterium]|nr:ATP synthase F1 subunit gamma [bacterium]
MTSQTHLKNKARAVKNIGQITKAMEMVSAAKMRKAQESALSARPYAKHMLSLFSSLLLHMKKEGELGLSLGKVREGVVCLVVVTSNKGLCGSYNSGVMRAALAWKERKEQEGKRVEVVTVGKKARDVFRKREAHIAQEFLNFSEVATIEDVSPVANWILQAKEKGLYEEMTCWSTTFISALERKATEVQILPFSQEAIERVVEGIIPKTGKYSTWVQEEREEKETSSVLLEPTPEELLEKLSDMLVRSEMLHLILESNAAEHSSRMVAMKNASDNAKDLMETLTLQLNKARQANITQEVAEIAAGKEALGV